MIVTTTYVATGCRADEILHRLVDGGLVCRGIATPFVLLSHKGEHCCAGRRVFIAGCVPKSSGVLRVVQESETLLDRSHALRVGCGSCILSPQAACDYDQNKIEYHRLLHKRPPVLANP